MGGTARLAVTVALILGAGAPVAPAQLPDAPDLVVELPDAPYGGPHAQVAPVYLDPHEVPGRLLYRFDAVLRNVGGTLDVWRDTETGAPIQGVWAGGRPGAAPDPRTPPPAGAAVRRVDRAGSGARLEYVVEPSHQHWHFFSAARYELVAGPETREGAKIGFCFFDGFDLPAAEGESYFAWREPSAGGGTWCAFDEAKSDFVRMGLSPGAADRYASQREFQWIDITGLPPGPAVLRATANAYGHLDEGGAVANNTTQVPRTVPGVRVEAATARTAAGTPVTVDLRAQVLAPEVPIRRAAGCHPSAADGGCYHRLGPADPVGFAISAPPAHGRVEITDTETSSVRARYTPDPGFSGRDALRYTATDGRGLTSPEATVTFEVSPPSDERAPEETRQPPVAGPRPIASLRVLRGRRPRLRIRLLERARLHVTLRPERGRSRRLRALTLPSGAHTVPLGRVRRGRRYGLTVTAVAGDRRHRRTLRPRVLLPR